MLKSRKKIKRVLAVCLICSIMLTALCGVSFAFSVPTETKSIDYFVDSLIVESYSSMDSLNEALSHLTPDSSVALSWYADSSRSTLCLVLSDHGLIELYNGSWGCSDSDATMYYGYFDTYNSASSQSAEVGSQVMNTHGDIDFYLCPLYGTFYLYDVYSLYFTNTFWIDSSTYYPANLEYGSYVDTRVFDVTQRSMFDSDYLQVTLNADIVDVTSLLTVSYSDEMGSYSYGYQPYEYIDVSGYSDVNTHETYTTFKVNVSSIPAYGSFTITGAELSTATLWGSKSVSLNFQYNGRDISLPNNYTDITYFNQFFNSEHNSSIGATFLGNLYFGVYDNGQGFYLRDSSDYLVENFDVKFIALPDFLWNTTGSDSANWALEEYYELFEQYDVVILGLGLSAFDELYGAGTYATLYINGWTVGSTINKIEKLTPDYVSTPKDLFDAHIQDFDWSNYYSNIGFIVTRNYLLKKTFYAMGDVDSRLLDFETKLLGENGSLSAIQDKLVTGLTNDNIFQNKVIDFMTDTTAFFNNLRVTKWFETVLERLDEIKGSLLNTFEPLEDLTEPFLSIYNFFTGVLTDMVDLLPDFQSYANKAVNPEVPMFPTPVPTVPLIPTLGGGYDVVPY